jgi:hypothetical protein
MKTTLHKGKLFLGKCDYDTPGKKNCEAYITFELEQGDYGPEFSAQAEIWQPSKRDILCGGQCVDKVAALFPDNVKAARVCEVWREWHLNGMNAGLPVQTAEVERQIEAAKVAHPEIVYPDGDVNFYKLADLLGLNGEGKKGGLGAGHYDLCLHWLKAANLYEVALPDGAVATGSFPAEVLSGERGYRYGERWVYRAMPAELVEEIKSW